MATASPQRAPPEPPPIKLHRRFTLKNVKLRSPFKCLTGDRPDEPLKLPSRGLFNTAAVNNVLDQGNRIDISRRRSVSASAVQQGEGFQRHLRRSLSVSTHRSIPSFAASPAKATEKPDVLTKAERVYDPFEAVEHRKRHMGGGARAKAVYTSPPVDSTLPQLLQADRIAPWKKSANITEMPPQVSRLPDTVSIDGNRYRLVATENHKFGPGLVRSPEQRQIVKRVLIEDDEIERPEGVDSVTFKRFSDLVKKHERNSGETSRNIPLRSEEEYYNYHLTPVARLARTGGKGKERMPMSDSQESGLGFANWEEIVDAINTDTDATVRPTSRSPFVTGPASDVDSLKPPKIPRKPKQEAAPNNRGSYLYMQEMDFETIPKSTHRRGKPRTPVKKDGVVTPPRRSPRNADARFDSRHNATSAEKSPNHQHPVAYSFTPRTSQDRVRFTEPCEGPSSIKMNDHGAQEIDEPPTPSPQDNHAEPTFRIKRKLVQVDAGVAQAGEPITVKYSPLPRTPAKARAQVALVDSSPKHVSPSSVDITEYQSVQDAHRATPKTSCDISRIIPSDTMVLISPRLRVMDSHITGRYNANGESSRPTVPYRPESCRPMGTHPLAAEHDAESFRMATSNTMHSIGTIRQRDFAYEADLDIDSNLSHEAERGY
ncbi:hypothetical protein BDD12DRAFT_934292 [Trichophaea hybrida]|nr:hypothetical protein BDD12DRAFT_934292 [Trichophaea hybrida]